MFSLDNFCDHEANEINHPHPDFPFLQNKPCCVIPSGGHWPACSSILKTLKLPEVLWVTLWVRAGNSTRLKFGVWHSECENIRPSPKSWTQSTFYNSPRLFMYSGRRCEVTGFHTFFDLPDILPSHLNRCYSEPITCGLFTSSFHHLSKSRQTNEARKRALLEATTTIMTTRSLWAVHPFIPNIIHAGVLAWTVGRRVAILSSKQGVPRAWSQGSWLIHFLLCSLSSGLFAGQKLITWRFRRGHRKEHFSSDVGYSPPSGPN